jgi:hypothetical protein
MLACSDVQEDDEFSHESTIKNQEKYSKAYYESESDGKIESSKYTPWDLTTLKEQEALALQLLKN